MNEKFKANRSSYNKVSDDDYERNAKSNRDFKKKNKKKKYSFEDDIDKKRMKNAYKQHKREVIDDDDWKNWEKDYK